MANHRDYVLKVSNLSVKIADETILDNVSFNLERGTTFAIVGPNGAGKSTLFRALLNLMPYTGKIEWMSKVKIGYVPQRLSVHDIPISVREFLAFKGTNNIENALNAVGLESQSVLNKSLGVLSGGQLQRVLIAWAIVDRPNVLLFDEPTTGVDVDSEESIYRMLSDFKTDEITILLISHDIHIINEYSEYMMALNKCVTFFGESKAIMNTELQKMIYGEPVCIALKPEE